jgi:hypothetical protein
MTLVTYTGLSDRRIITSADFSDIEEEFDDLVWGPGETLDVPDTIAERITETMRNEFINRSDTTRDLRSKEELYELAQEYGIKGRSNMDREELLEAITTHEISLEGDAPDGLEGSPSEKPEEA